MSSFMVETPSILGSGALAVRVTVTDDLLSVELADGRTIGAPLAWYPRLAHATRKERNAWRLIAAGRGIHWSDLDEDISVANLLSGQPSCESQASLSKWLSGREGNKPSRRATGRSKAVKRSRRQGGS